MSGRTRLALGLLAALVVLLAANALATSAETEPAEVTVPGGRVLDLPGGDVQVLDRGRRDDSAIVLIHGFTGSVRWSATRSARPSPRRWRKRRPNWSIASSSSTRPPTATATAPTSP